MSDKIINKIRSIKHKGLRLLYEKNDSSKLNPDHITKITAILTRLDTIEVIEDMNFPGSNLHKLSGDLAEFYSVKVSGNYRIIFRFEDGFVYDIDYLDYH